MNMLASFILSWLVLALAMWGTASLLPGISLRSFGDAVVVAGVFGLLNWLVGYALYLIMGFMTLGLAFLFKFLTRTVINALLLLITASLTPRLRVRSFGWAFGGALCMSALGTVGEMVLLH